MRHVLLALHPRALDSSASPAGLLARGSRPAPPSRDRSSGRWRGLAAHSCGGSRGLGHGAPTAFPLVSLREPTTRAACAKAAVGAIVNRPGRGCCRLTSPRPGVASAPRRSPSPQGAGRRGNAVQFRGCPRNCKRRARAIGHWRGPGRRREGGDPRARRPAVAATYPDARRVTRARRTCGQATRFRRRSRAARGHHRRVPVVPAGRRAGGRAVAGGAAGGRCPARGGGQRGGGARGGVPRQLPAGDERGGAAAGGVELRLRLADAGERRRPGGGGAAAGGVGQRLHAVSRPARGAEARAGGAGAEFRHIGGPAGDHRACAHSLHRRHRVSRGRQDHADPASAGERERAADRADHQRVRRPGGGRRDPEGLRDRGCAATTTWWSCRTAASAARWPRTSSRRCRS